MEPANTIDIGIQLTVRATYAQKEAFARHAGARRFAYNWCVANKRTLQEKRKEGHIIKIPVSSFDNINPFNEWKRSADAGRDENGKIGISWRQEGSSASL